MVRAMIWGACLIATWALVASDWRATAEGAEVVAAGTKAQGELETKLLGTWRGGACRGTIELRADGTFERLGYSPGGNRLSGTWRISWDALPPTLALDCLDSDADHFIGKQERPKLMVLSEKHLGMLTLDPKSAWPAGDRETVARNLSLYERMPREAK